VRRAPSLYQQVGRDRPAPPTRVMRRLYIRVTPRLEARLRKVELLARRAGRHPQSVPLRHSDQETRRLNRSVRSVRLRRRRRDDVSGSAQGVGMWAGCPWRAPAHSTPSG
jgi:hypothetical protein